MTWTYLFSADIHVPNSNSPISWTRHQLPRQLDVADSLHLVTANKAHTIYPQVFKQTLVSQQILIYTCK